LQAWSDAYKAAHPPGVTSDVAKVERKIETNKKNPRNLSQKVLNGGLDGVLTRER
jgi:hypothetical protein